MSNPPPETRVNTVSYETDTDTRHLVKSAYQKKNFSYISTNTYVVGAQKNCRIETVLLSTQYACLNQWIRK